MLSAINQLLIYKLGGSCLNMTYLGYLWKLLDSSQGSSPSSWEGILPEF